MGKRAAYTLADQHNAELQFEGCSNPLTCYPCAVEKLKHIDRARTPEQTARLLQVIDRAFEKFRGDIGELEAAIGMFSLGHHFGWRVLYTMHSKRTIRKYEEILDIAVRDEFPEVGPYSARSIGYRVVESVSNFWKAISGSQPIPDRRMIE